LDFAAVGKPARARCGADGSSFATPAHCPHARVTAYRGATSDGRCFRGRLAFRLPRPLAPGRWSTHRCGRQAVRGAVLRRQGRQRDISQRCLRRRSLRRDLARVRRRRRWHQPGRAARRHAGRAGRGPRTAATHPVSTRARAFDGVRASGGGDRAVHSRRSGQHLSHVARAGLGARCRRGDADGRCCHPHR
jgi:hypothetical protein